MAAKIVMDDGGGPVTGSIEVPASTLVTLSNLNDTGVAAWAWTLRDKPAGSAATLSASNVASPTITPDIEGEYLIELITYRDAAMTVFDGSDTQVVGIRYAGPYAWLLPAAGQTNQRDSGKGWKVELNAILTQIRSALAAVVSGINQLTGDATAGPGSGSQAVTVVQARGLRETGGPTTLTMGAVADGEYLLRSGNTIVGGGGSTVLYDMPIATASVGTAVFVRDEADNPAAPGSTAASSIVDIQAGPDLTAKALRLALSGGSDAGGWIFPIDCGALPDEGFVVEIVFSGMDVNALGGFFMPLADFTTVPGTVEGLAVSFFSGVYNTTAEFDVTSSTFARFVAGPSLQGWPSSPTQSRCDKGPHVQRIEVRRAQGTTPATWMVKQTLESPDGTYVVSSAVSGVSNPVTSFDGKTYTQIGIGPWVPGGYTPPCHIDIQSLRVLALGS